MEKVWIWTKFETINVDNHRQTSYALHTDERIVTTFKPVLCQFQGFSSVVRMSVYFCVVVVALLAPVADTAICVASDQFEGTYQLYNKEIYRNFAQSVSRQMRAFTTFVLDENYKPIIYERNVLDFNVKVKFDIPANAPCSMSKIKTDMHTEIPDNSIRLDKFPLPLPEDLPEGIEYWRYKWVDNDSAIVGVLRSPPNICILVVWGPLNKQNELILEEAGYIRGNYSLRIRNFDVFNVTPMCLPGNDKSV